MLTAFLQDNAATEAAAISFYAVTALSPLLVVLVSLASVLVPDDVFKGYLLHQTDQVFGNVISGFVGTVLSEAKSASGWAAVAGLAFMLISAAALFAQLHLSLNKVWRISPAGGTSFKLLLKDRLVALVVVLLTGALLISSLFLSAMLEVAGQWLSQSLALHVNTVTLTQNGLAFFLLTAMCALLFKTLPDTTITWRDVASGAAVTAALFLVTKSIFAYWLARSNVTAGYGQVGAVVLLLLWVYFSSVVFLLGAEWTALRANARGRTIRSLRRSTAQEMAENQDFPVLEAVVPPSG